MAEYEASWLGFMGTRECVKCRKVKPLTEFSVEPKIRSGYQVKCKDCEAVDDAKWRMKVVDE